MATLTPEQYERWHNAKRNDDKQLMAEIEAEGYNGINKDVIDVEVESAGNRDNDPDALLPSVDEIDDGLVAGRTYKQIGEEYGISAQKVKAIHTKG